MIPKGPVVKPRKGKTMLDQRMRSRAGDTTVTVISALLVVSLIWAIAASVIAKKKSTQLIQMTDEAARIRADADAMRAEAERRMMDAAQRSAQAEELRKVAVYWAKQYQAQLSEAKAAQAAAQAKPAATSNKTATSSKSSTTGSKPTTGSKSTTAGKSSTSGKSSSTTKKTSSSSTTH